ncbi:hypothetical protein BGW80DRAFT_1277286 [Lactifluus volemus]|nr:hypothetical protein BGW80DRAFT_1277286 [Lactifluus volemus]
MSQFVLHLSSSLYTDCPSQVAASWDDIQGHVASNTPEVVPGMSIVTSTKTSTSSSIGSSTWSTLTYTSKTPTASATAASTSSSSSDSSRGSSFNVAIAGGAVGGIIAISGAALIVYFLRQRMPLQGSATAAVSESRTSERPLYNPDDQTTYGYQGSNPMPVTNQVPAAPNTGGAIQPPTHHDLPCYGITGSVAAMQTCLL